MGRLQWAVATVALAVVLTAPAAGATTFIPDTVGDAVSGDGDCSLREAVTAANTNAITDACPAGGASDEIFLTAGVYLLTRGGVDDTNVNGDLDVNASNLTIAAFTRGPTVIDGGFGADRVFDIDGPVAGVTIDGIEIRNGATPAFGGGILNDGSLTLTNVTLAGNSAGQRGGGLANIDTATLTNVTVSGNGSQVGGGIYADEDANTTLNNVTVTDNSGDVTLSQGGGGIARDNTGGPGVGTLELSNTLVAGNRSFLNGTVGATSPDCSGAPTSNGYNLIGSGSGCALSPNTGDVFGELPRLGRLTENGGTTRTHLPAADSAARNAGDPGASCASGDQRGISRPREGRCDIGAVERLVENPLTVTTTQDQLGGGTPGACSLREAIQAANTNASVDNCGTGSATALDVISLGNLSPQITRANTFTDNDNSFGDLDVLAPNVVITGAGGTVNQINAGGPGIASDRVLDIHSAGSGVEIDGVDIAGGDSGPTFDGGAIQNSGELILRDVTLEQNHAGDDGGGLANFGVAVLRNVTLSENTADDTGGGVLNSLYGSLNNVTVAGNVAATAGGGIAVGGFTPSLANSALTDNLPFDCSGVIASAGRVALGTGAGCSVVSAPDGEDLIGQPVGLHPITFTGGARVLLPEADSSLTDGGAPASGGGSRCEPTDQRGIARPQFGTCDIGAVELGPVTLTVTPGGAGSGTVSGTGIACPGDCDQVFHEGAEPTLSAAAAAGSSFAGWGGACSGNSTCQPSLFADTAVTAQFESLPALPSHELAVTVAGAGLGTVTGPGISCPGDCSESYEQGTAVTLTANANPASEFAGWSGDCTGTTGCELTLTAGRHVTASFTPLPGDDFTDRDAPDTAIVAAPAKRTAKRKASLEFTASEPRSTFECSLDGAAFTPCTSPHKLKRLSRKRHAFAVRAIDAAKNVDPTPATISWRVKKKRRPR